MHTSMLTTDLRMLAICFIHGFVSGHGFSRAAKSFQICTRFSAWD
jgi:hypothetical protein